MEFKKLTHIRKLTQGKQGITGLCRYEREGSSSVECVYKISQYMNHLPKHEALIIQGLEDIQDYCPHFCGYIDCIQYPLHYNFRDMEQDPFAECDKPIYIDVLLIEYIENKLSFQETISDPSTPTEVIFSIMKQVLLAIVVAQRDKSFVHYDLHSMNILIERTEYDTVHLYRLDEETVISVPTYGYHPVIIDFGFSSSQDLNNHPSYLALAYTDSGFLSPAYDLLNDAKLFLISLLDDMNTERMSQKKVLWFRNILFRIFGKLQLDWESGWDVLDKHSIADQILRYVKDIDTKSKLFRNYGHICMDLLQSMCILPLSPKVNGTLHHLKISYDAFVYQMQLIEAEVNNTFFTLYVFRKMVDYARELRPLFTTDRNRCVNLFSQHLFTIVRSVAAFCPLKEVNVEQLLLSLYIFTEQLEYQLYTRLDNILKRKRRDYAQLPVSSTADIFTILDINLEDDYTYSSQSIIRLFDAHEKMSSEIELTEKIARKVNKAHPSVRGMYIHEKANC